jgi:excisionase family DNA binding protein
MTVVLLSPEQVAERLGLSRSTLAKLRLTGGGPRFLKLGAAVRYPEEELAIWLASKPRRASTSDGVADQLRSAASHLDRE